MKTICVTFLLAFFVSSCISLNSDASFDEVSRVPSPDGQVDALLVETNGGATTSFGYSVFVVPKGVRLKSRDDKYIVATLYGAVRSKSAYGANLNWPARDRLSIEYLDAKSAKVLNSRIIFADYHVSVELNKGIEDSSAPAGGMLYNLEKQK
ncbi:MAG: hypothetical protein IPM21_12330 [Acidobacteria bacterium]|nr:hypothetical protein [Acidobacteriota bacterium]